MAQRSTRLLLWITAIGLIIMVAATIAAVLLIQTGPPKLNHEPRWLEVRVSSQVDDAPGNEGMFTEPGDMPPLTTELAAALRYAATDPEVEGIRLEVTGLGLGWAQVQELRDALVAVREAGKPCVAWADSMGNREYFLASACPELHLAPAGLALVNGLSVTHTYYKGAFDRFGVSANFEHVGQFKSAVEPYERTGPSDAAQQATDALLDSLYGQLIAAVADGRGLSIEDATTLVEDPPITPEDALARGLVDALDYRDEVLIDDEDAISIGDYLSDRRSDWKHGDATIAVIYAEGAIISGTSEPDMWGGHYIGDKTLRKQLQDVREDDDIAAVVLRVNSPGGSGSASDAIWREVELTRAVKPVVVSMADYAASGGYYISASADRIVAEPTTLTGSIGVFGGKMNIAGVYESLDLSLHTDKRGHYATLLSSTSDFSEDERAKFRTFLDAFYKTFLQRVADGRELQVGQVHALAQGRVWTGEQAVENGLVDKLGGLDVAIEEARQLADLSGELEIQRIPKRQSFVEQLMEQITEPDPDASAMVPPDVAAAVSTWTRLSRVLDGSGVAAMMPGEITVE